MGATIRRNGDNSRQAIKRAEITANRRRREFGRREERFYDERAFNARFSQ